MESDVIEVIMFRNLYWSLLNEIAMNMVGSIYHEGIKSAIDQTNLHDYMDSQNQKPDICDNTVVDGHKHDNGNIKAW